MTGRIAAACVVLALLGAVPATAQTVQQKRLKGVTEATVVIEDLNDDSASCGITYTDLTTAASKALLDNGVRVIERSLAAASSRSTVTLGPPVLHVRVHTLFFRSPYHGEPRQCVSHIRVKLYNFLTATPYHSAQPVFGQFTLAESSYMNASGNANHGQRIRDGVFEQAEEIAEDIRIANQ